MVWLCLTPARGGAKSLLLESWLLLVTGWPVERDGRMLWNFGQIEGEKLETVTFNFLGPQKSLQMVTATMKLKGACPLEGNL